SAYLAGRERRAREVARAAARQETERREAKQRAYDQFRRAQAADIFANLPEAEQQAIKTLAASQVAKSSGPLRNVMFDFAKVRITIERHGDQLKTFAQWEVETIH